MKWVAIDGEFDFAEGVVFHGRPTPYATPQGEDKVGLAFGLAMSSERFSGGELSAHVSSNSWTTAGSSCELVFYFDPTRRLHVSAGIGGVGGSAFVIRQWDRGWETYATAGNRTTLRPSQKYEVKVVVRGSRVALFR